MPGYGDVCGAITVVRCGTQPPLGFRELGILSQIGEFTGAAATACADTVVSHSPGDRW